MPLPSAPPDLCATFHTRAPKGCLPPSGRIPRQCRVDVVPGRWPYVGQDDVQGDVHADDSSMDRPQRTRQRASPCCR
jgi:hypothetical protein